jgi:uncharacterized protein (TIGR03790 family)
MSDAWPGYRLPGRRRRWRGRWALVAGAALGAALLFLGIGRCLPSASEAFHAPEDNLAAATAVIYNENDPLSRDLAEYYAQKRGIDPANIVGLKCPLEEEISREEYDSTIAEPLRAVFDERHWWVRAPESLASGSSNPVIANHIRYLAVIRGVPLKIKQTANYPGDGTTQPAPYKDINSASVDSELSVLGVFTRHISGILNNPYYGSHTRFTDFSSPGMMLAARLDAPTGEIVRRMIDDSLAAERDGLWGRCYVDSRGIPPNSSPFAVGDQWMRRISDEIMPPILPTVLDDQPALFADAYPMTGAALYYGWYSEQPAGAVAQSGFRFLPGAVAFHLHSFSATSVRDSAHWWVGPMLMRGAAAVLGNVYEPYLNLTTHFDDFAERLAAGMTLAESAYAATPGLSWMNDVIGDPLYRPGLQWAKLKADLDAGRGAGESSGALAREGRAYFEGAQAWRTRGAAAGAKLLERSGARLHSGLIDEGLGLLEAAAHDLPKASAAFQLAARNDRDRQDAVRAVLDEAQAFARAGDRTSAIRVLEAGRKKYGTDGAASLFGVCEAGLAPAPPKAAPRP